jgi:hypothetical protein
MAEEKVEIDPEILEHFDKCYKSMINDFFEGEETLKSELFYRLIRGKPLFTEEEIEKRVNKWIEKEKEIWNVPTES